MVVRITATDPDVQMPPPAAHKKPLTEEQVRLLLDWIAAGVPWGSHWAFEVPARPTVPDRGQANPVDQFVADRPATSCPMPPPRSSSPPASIATT